MPHFTALSLAERETQALARIRLLPNARQWQRCEIEKLADATVRSSLVRQGVLKTRLREAGCTLVREYRLAGKIGAAP